MRKLKVLLLTLIMITAITLPSCGNTIAPNKLEQNLTEKAAELCNEMRSYEKDVQKIAKYYGMPSNITWIENPMTMEEAESNIVYAYMIGRYDLNFYYSNIESTEITYNLLKGQNIYTPFGTHPDLMGFYLNVPLHVEESNGCIKLVRDEGQYFTMEELYERQKKAEKKAIEINNKLHNSGIITDSMSLRQKAEKLFYYLNGLKIKTPDISINDPNSGEIVDGLYSILINKESNCGGKAGLTCIMMHLNGIPCQGITMEGHIFNRLVLDGNEYFMDISGYNLLRYSELDSTGFLNRKYIDTLSLKRARQLSPGNII